MHNIIKVPEREFGPAPWWGWMGNVTEQGIDEDLGRFLGMNIYEIIVIPLYGLKQEYLGPEYFRLYRHLCQRCREWGLKLWIYDEFNWPSGTAAGEVLEKYPSAKQRVIKFSWPHDDYSALPAWEITEYAGHDLAAYGSEWSRWSSGYLDVLDREAVGSFINLTHEAYKRELGEYFGDVIVGFFTDEPVVNKAAGMSFPYTAALFRLFHDKYGYELESNLLALVKDIGEFHRIRRDYWSLISELFKNNYFRQIADWCAANQLKLTGHLLFEEILAGNTGKNGDVYDMLAAMQVPAIDVLMGDDSFNKNPTGCYASAFGNAKCLDVSGKILESVTFFAGKERNLCEAFGCALPSSTARFYKRASDFLLHHGVNMINDNLFTDSNASFRKLTACHTFWTPWVRHYGALSQHIATMSFLNAQSRLVTNLGIYYPGTDIQARFGPPDTIFGIAGLKTPANEDWRRTQNTIHELCHGLITRQWDYYLMFDQVIEQAELQDGALCHAGFTCKVLVFPAIHFISTEVARKISGLLASGGAIICVGCIPRVLDNNGKITKLQFTGGNALLVPESGAAATDATVKILTGILKRDLEISGNNIDDILVTHRHSRMGELAFVTNFGDTTTVFNHNFSAEWRELDTIRRAVGGMIEQPCKMEPDESRLFIKTGGAGDAGSIYTSQNIVELDGAWRLRPAVKNTLPLPLSVYRQIGVQCIESLNMNPAAWHAAGLEVAPVEFIPGKTYWLRCVINMPVIPELLTITADGVDAIEIYAARLPVRHPTGMLVWDDDNISYDLKNMVKAGENEILIKYVPARDRQYFQQIPAWGSKTKDDLPLIVLSGDFAASSAGDTPELNRAPDEIHAGSLSDQGFPHFYGELAFERKFSLNESVQDAILDLRRQNDTFEVEVNGTPAGILCWPPYRLNIGHRLRRGENTIMLRLFTARAGLTTRFYMSREKDIPSMGLLDTPIIHIQ